MPLIPIPDIDDPRLDPYRSLKTTNRTRWEEIFVVEGEKLARRLLESDFEPLHILCGDSYLDRIADVMPPELPVYIIPTRTIDDLIGFQFHRGILACGKRRPTPDLQTILDRNQDRFTCVLCPDVTDPENLGAIIRISSGFGVDLLLLGPRCPDPFSRRILRVSMGTVLKLPVVHSQNLEDHADRLARSGVELAATILDPSAEPLHTARRPNRFALLFGNEGEGLSPDWIARAERRITIPMQNGTDSLNVAVASGIFLHHFTSPAAFHAK